MINKGMIDPLRIKSLPSNLERAVGSNACCLVMSGLFKGLCHYMHDLADAFRLFFSSLPKYAVGAEERRSVGKIKIIFFGFI